MRHVPYPDTGNLPKEEWLEKAALLTDSLVAAPDKASRDKLIDDNSAFWGEIKEWLEGFSYGKCWFSEARDTCSHWQVEHFRPKKEAKDPPRDGYWWLAFDYRNFRLCGSVSNTKKGSYFPLRAGTTPALSRDDNHEDEAPVLIDPTIESDVMLLTFVDGGIASPAVADPNDWHHQRAKRSIERYKLNDYPPLSRARQQIWNQCRNDVEELEILMAAQKEHHSPSRQMKITMIAERLKDRTRRSAPFSSVARAFLAKYPKDWVKNCIA